MISPFEAYSRDELESCASQIGRSDQRCAADISRAEQVCLAMQETPEVAPDLNCRIVEPLSDVAEL